MRAAADRYTIGVPGDEANAVERHAQPLCQELCKAGLVALPVRDRAEDDLHHLPAVPSLRRSRGAPVAVST
jgi:hypothetical protein